MKNKKKPRFHCKSEAQRKAIRKRYAVRNSDKRVEAPYPHFRYYRKSRHPALIVGEQKRDNVEEYRYRKVMHNDHDGRHSNEIIYPNPNKNDPDPMCIGKRVRHDKKDNFDPMPMSWEYPKK